MRLTDYGETEANVVRSMPQALPAELQGTASVEAPSVSKRQFATYLDSISRVRMPRLQRRIDVEETIVAVPIEIWEGEVTSIDAKAHTFQALLVSKKGGSDNHTVEIDTEWIDEQDLELLRPGAIFYLSLGRSNRRGSIENSEKIRFRRRPDWTVKQVEEIHKHADTFLKALKPRPVADD